MPMTEWARGFLLADFQLHILCWSTSNIVAIFVAPIRMQVMNTGAADLQVCPNRSKFQLSWSLPLFHRPGFLGIQRDHQSRLGEPPSSSSLGSFSAIVQTGPRQGGRRELHTLRISSDRSYIFQR